jgi:hypothetical protein
LAAWVRAAALLLLAGCRASEARSAAPAVNSNDLGPSSDAPVVDAAVLDAMSPGPRDPADATPQFLDGPAAQFNVLGNGLRLIAESGVCWLVRGTPKHEEERLRLDLSPPCYFMIWRHRPPRKADAEGLSDGVPVGGPGDPVAWTYRSARGATVLMITGDPIDAHWRDRAARHTQCAGNAQGLVLRRERMSLAKKSRFPGLHCADWDSGIEEKDFWIAAHES